MLGLILVILLTIILLLIINNNYEKFIANPSLALDDIDKKTRKESKANEKISYERNKLNLGLIHKVKKCYDTRRKDYYDCVLNLPLVLDKQARKIKEKKYVNYIRYKNIKDLYPQSFK